MVRRSVPPWPYGDVGMRVRFRAYVVRYKLGPQTFVIAYLSAIYLVPSYTDWYVIKLVFPPRLAWNEGIKPGVKKHREKGEKVGTQAFPGSASISISKPHIRIYRDAMHTTLCFSWVIYVAPGIVRQARLARGGHECGAGVAENEDLRYMSYCMLDEMRKNDYSGITK
ncbi:uncharacterized protein EI90DRAFT_3289408 [Cantharellus anzutake]|uniref:uncharacterized protein n=1 Tax=Cantharellus anzutake TaxID=1750568 RepID=UPI0019074EB2|nr:uncharacterized protein EI90DRAFT_3289408 [Cantharellus anzutake]KAF8331287.1 hypothetical protein EI90DRAFT_3289408 [Cantharellus anzutake]